MVEKIWSTTYILFESTQQQNRIPFIVFDKKNREVCGKFYDMNLDFKTVQLGYTGTAVLLEERIKQALQILLCNMLLKL
jgi:hypothetical protein